MVDDNLQAEIDAIDRELDQRLTIRRPVVQPVLNADGDPIGSTVTHTIERGTFRVVPINPPREEP